MFDVLVEIFFFWICIELFFVNIEDYLVSMVVDCMYVYLYIVVYSQLSDIFYFWDGCGVLFGEVFFIIVSL